MSTEQNIKYKQQQQARAQKRTVTKVNISQNKNGSMSIDSVKNKPSGLAKR
jgi:hypothetical protein